MLYSLALLPTVVLLIFIYHKDQKEKEPLGLLISCFLMGVLSIIPICILELIEDGALSVFYEEGSVPYALIDGFIVAGLSEELGKYLFLKMRTWKNKNFDCMFDGIVYAVFVSLGFAGLENIMYVVEGGLSTAITRMFTSVPGHMVFSVYMGYFYSKAKLAQVKGDGKAYRRNKRCALWIPVLLHGTYDFLIMVDSDVAGEWISILFIILWIVYLVVLFIGTFIFVNRASKNDTYIEYPQEGAAMLYSSIKAGDWKCTCGAMNTLKYCGTCGLPRPLQQGWNCPYCGNLSFWPNCGECGSPKPVEKMVGTT